MTAAPTKAVTTLRSAMMGLALFGLLLAVVPEGAAAAPRGAEKFARSLSPAERKLFEEYLSAQATHDFKSDAYWREVSDKKALRRGKRSKGEVVTAKDYVRTFPPKYDGPELTAGLAKRWAAYQAQDSKPKDKPPPRPLPGLPEFLEAAEVEYGFRPERIPEREFKLRYAREAVSLGLTGEQVVRVYALETSGLGTADMVSGIHPIKKTGKPISSAIGYAQLLTANTTDELARHGPRFLARLKAMASDRGLAPERRRALANKHEKLSTMIKAARSIPHKWDRHVAFARTRRGMGIHAINIDGDIGPWLQAVKLHGLKEMADKAGIGQLTGAEIELMNLAGPGTGLEMMRPAARNAATTNFFARDAYFRNTIVRDKTSAELLVALDKRMDQNITNPGAIEFAEAFREVSREIASGR
ncbi:hypothetical protein [Hyphomicrobium sp.]|uniref:hypothetical protein n=1 Tax=Hyphomicrobium sp. TaxID=82 RepID=UPI0025BD6654|nr:hypothetical protein [Hyphomicrobium sp.]MCC7252060.1 hypothetical protein [Hyphomicrobium sp.]